MASAKDLIRTAFDEHGRMTGAIMSPVTSLNGPSLTVGTPATVVVSKLMDFGALLSIGEHEASACCCVFHIAYSRDRATLPALFRLAFCTSQKWIRNARTESLI
jgi:hypothetical protein